MTKKSVNNKGWYNESKRHSLASRGIETKPFKTEIKYPDKFEDVPSVESLSKINRSIHGDLVSVTTSGRYIWRNSDGLYSITEERDGHVLMKNIYPIDIVELYEAYENAEWK